MANTYLSRTQSTGTSDKKGTFSAWIKASDSNFAIFSGHTDSNNRIALYLNETLRVYGAIGGSQSVYFITNRVIRDYNAWYNIVVAWDTTQGTEANRFKIYVNGVQETSFSTSAYPSQNSDIYWNKGTTSIVGARFISAVQNQLNGSMSHVHFIDGTAYTASAFGSTDSTTGEWKINTSPSVTYGNNGFFILKDGNSVTDSSTNSNNFTVGGGTLTKTEDNPSNVFCTVNALDSFYQNTTLSEGNTKIAFNNGWAFNTGTLGFNSGKWYWEVRSNNWSAGNQSYGITSAVADASDDEYYNNSGSGRGYGLYNNGTVYGNGILGTGYTSSGYGYIGMIAVDADTNQIWFGANGSWETGSGPGSTGISIVSASTQDSGFWFPAFSGGINSAGNDFKINFGNGYFGTTAITSAGSNASGIGIFEYDVPTGYTALSTKGLNL